MFGSGYDFKQDFTPLLNYFDIKPVLTTNKNLQANSPVDRVHQVILDILVAKDITNKFFENIDP